MTIIDTTIGPHFEISAPTVRVKDQSVFNDQVNEFLNSGGKIQKIQFGQMADSDHSVAAQNARTWFLEHPDAAPVTGEIKITEAQVSYAIKHLGAGIASKNMASVAKKLGVDEVALRREVHKRRSKMSGLRGVKKANEGKGNLRDN